MTFRIAYMTGEYPRATDTFIQREVAMLRSLGHTVETFSVRKPGEKEQVGDEVKAERARTHYLLPAPILKLMGAHARLLFSTPGKYLAGWKLAMQIRPPGIKAFARQLAYIAEAGLVARLMKRLNLQHLHNHFANSSCSVATIASAMGGFTFSFTMHGPSEFFEPKYWRIDEKIRRALFVNCISYFCRSQAMVFSPMSAWEKMHIVHCGVDPTLFDRRVHRGTGQRLLYVGRLAAVKGLPILLAAMAKLSELFPEVKLSVAGDGPDRAALQQLAKTLGVADRVDFLGYQSQSAVRALLGQTDVFAMSSFAEGVPVVLMEAMAAGVPVVATRIAGIAELVEDGASGFLVAPGDANATADAIARILADSALRTAMGQAGRDKVEREFNINTEARWLAKVMAGALQGTNLALCREPGVDESLSLGQRELIVS